jgi:hypothetical protein
MVRSLIDKIGSTLVLAFAESAVLVDLVILGEAGIVLAAGGGGLAVDRTSRRLTLDLRWGTTAATVPLAMADLDPWGSERTDRPRPRAPRPTGGAWERLEHLDRPRSSVPAPVADHRGGLGALWAVIVPMVALAAAWVFLRAVPCSGKSCVVPGAAGWGAGLLAVPTAPLAGLPWQSGPVAVTVAAVTSMAVWILIGWWAHRRGAAGMSAGGQVVWLAAAVWLGSLTGLLVGVLALAG